MDIWVPVIVAIVTGSIAYFGSVHTNKNALNALRIKNESDLNKLEKEHKNEMDKMASEFERALKIQENEIVNDITRNFFPEKTLNKMGDKILNDQGVQDMILSSVLSEMNKTNNK